MEGPFARPIGLSRKAILDGIPKYTKLLSAVLAEPVKCGRTVPHTTERPTTIPAGNYCVSNVQDKHDPALFILATRLVFTTESGEVAADYRSIVLGDVSGAKRGADVVTFYDRGMEVEHNRRTAIIYASDAESNAVVMRSTLFPPEGSLLLV